MRDSAAPRAQSTSLSEDSEPRESAFYAAIPAVFVFLWATGFIAAKTGLAHAEALTFLSIRYALVTVLMLGVALVMRAEWPRSWREAGHIAVAGIMLQAVYFGGVWLSLQSGVGAGVSAVILSMQPVLTAAVVGPWLGERVSVRQWGGLLLGAVGVALVVANKLALGHGTLLGMGWSFMALLGITAGTLYQKRFCPRMDPRSGTCIQFLVAAALLYPLSLVFETGEVDWTPEFVAALVYVSIVLSLIAISLLTIMIRRGEASRVSSLFFLVAPTAALLGYFILGESLGAIALAGMAVAVLGVALVILPGRGSISLKRR